MSAGSFLPLLIMLVLLAVFLRGDFALTVLYLIVGALVAGVLWSRQALTQVRVKRQFPAHAFLDEEVHVELHVQNMGWLPLPWLELRENLPVALVGPNNFQSVIHLGPRGDAKFTYKVHARKRGYYPIGPFSVFTGDILGLRETVSAQLPAEYLVVYPRIVALSSVRVPSHSPQGTLPHTLPLFEDPTRAFGKRGYTSRDSMRRIDWKASAAAGELQVKVFEPSIALETYIVLNLHTEDYYYRSRIDSSELAIVIAASLANWIIARKQTAGLIVNGRDPLADDQRPHPLPGRKGKPHLMRMLETLARVELVDQAPFAPVIQEQRYHLAWGTTLIVITGAADSKLLDQLHQSRREGQNPLLILAGRDAGDQSIRRQAESFGIPTVVIATEHDLRIWMQGRA